MRYCGIDVSARAEAQQLCTLHERRGAEGPELVATFYEPGDVAAVARTVLGFGGEAVVALDAPTGHRLDLLAPGEPLRETLGLPSGRFERHRVCDALLFRRRMPLYPVPASLGAQRTWETWIATAFALAEALAPLGRFTPPPPREVPANGDQAPDAELRGSVEPGALRFGRLCETYPEAVFCALLGHRPSSKRTPSGLQQRIAALRLRGVADDDGGLWHRSLPELDACAVAYAAHALATAQGIWVGAPGEGVIVLPTDELRDAYGRLPPPARTPLAVAPR